MKINKAALFIILPLMTLTVNAETIDEFEVKLDEMQEDQILKQTQLEDNYSVQKNIKEQIAELDRKLSEIQFDIDKVSENVLDIAVKIDNAKKEYFAAKEKSKKQYEKVSKRLRYIYESENTNNIDILLKSKSIMEYYKYKQYIQDIMNYDSKILEELKETEELMKNKLEEIERREETQIALECFKSERELEMAATYEKRTRLLKEYQNDADLMEDEIKKMKEASDKVAEIITNMKENEDFVNTYTGGQLEWPVEGRYYVSSDYVGRISPVGNGYEFHTGIDIPAPKGYEIIAAEDGVVINAGWIKGYGNTVIINHGGGISTLYGHNSEVLVKVGDNVKRGDNIALCGATGYATGNHCHFEVRVNGEHTNPWEYLKRK